MLGFLRKKQEHNGYGLRLKDYINPEESIMKIASSEVVKCNENDRIIDVLASMLSGVRRMPVLDDAGEVRGVVSATDVLDFIGGGEKSKMFTNTGLSAVVKKIMTPDVQCLASTDSVPVALEIFKMNRRPIHPVTSQRKLQAVLTESDLVNIISRPTGMKVQSLMSSKPLVTQEDTPVCDVAKMLCRGAYRRLPVVNKGVLTGIVTPYDILSHLNRNESLNSLKSEVSPIKGVMNRKAESVTPWADISDAVRLMKIRKVSGLPVVDEDMDVLGMISKRDMIEVMS
jgi:CBS domain-containing protein